MQSKWGNASPVDIVRDFDEMVSRIIKPDQPKAGISGELRELERSFDDDKTKRKIVRLQPYQRDLIHFIRSNKKIKIRRGRC